MLVLLAMLPHQLLHLLEFLHYGVYIVVFPNIINSSNNYYFKSVAVLQYILDQCSGDISYPGPNNAFNFKMIRNFQQSGLVSDSVQSAASEDNPLGGVTGLDGGLQLLTHGTHEVPLGPLVIKNSLLQGGEVVVPDHCCCGNPVPVS